MTSPGENWVTVDRDARSAAEERRSDGATWWEPLDNGTGPDAKAATEKGRASSRVCRDSPRANTGWGDRPTRSARIEGRPRPFGPDECRGKLPGARHSAAVRGVSLETGA